MCNHNNSEKRILFFGGEQILTCKSCHKLKRAHLKTLYQSGKTSLTLTQVYSFPRWERLQRRVNV